MGGSCITIGGHQRTNRELRIIFQSPIGCLSFKIQIQEAMEKQINVVSDAT